MQMFYVLALCLAAVSAAPVSEDSTVTNLEGHGISAEMDLPSAFVTSISTPEGEHTLRLVRNEKLHKMAPAELYLGDDKINVQERDVSYYHGTGGEAAYVALERRDGTLRMSGLLFKSDNLYEISPVEIDESEKRSVDEHLHTVKRSPEHLLDAYRQRVEMSVQDLPADENVDQQEPDVPVPELPKILKAARDSDEPPKSVPDLPDEKSGDACTPKLYTVELLFMMDFTMYNYYVQRPDLIKQGSNPVEELHYRSEQIMNTMDGIYTESFASTCTRFELKLIKVVVAQNKADSWYVEENIISADKNNVDDMHPEKTRSDANKILDSMGEWLKQNGYNYHNPDHAMSFTKYDILGTNLNPSTVGLAPLRGVCKPSSTNGNSIGVSTIEMTSPHSDIACAHELGHNVGSPHDGQPGEGSSCDGGKGNVMGPTVNSPGDATTPNLYLFSSCSRQSISKTLMGTDAIGYPRNCLVEQVCGYSNEVKPLTGLGEITPKDLQCKEFTGLDGYTSIDLSRLSGQTKDFCEQVVCYKAATGTLLYKSLYWPERGTACGTNKKCIMGRCLDNTLYHQKYHALDNARIQCSAVKNNSPSGCTQKNYNININDASGKTVDVLRGCTDIVARRPDLCFNGFGGHCCTDCYASHLIQV